MEYRCILLLWIPYVNQSVWFDKRPIDNVKHLCSLVIWFLCCSKQCIQQTQSFDFLGELVQNVPDIEDEQVKSRKPRKPRAKKGEGKPRAAASKAKAAREEEEEAAEEDEEEDAEGDEEEEEDEEEEGV